MASRGPLDVFKIKSNCSSRLEPCYSERTHHITLNAYNDLSKECIVGFIENIDILTDHRFFCYITF